MFSNRDISQDVGVVADKHSIAQRGMPFSGALSGSPQGHTLVERHVIPNDCSLANDHADSVIDKQTSTDLRLWMDFNSGPKARDLRQHTWQQPQVMRPQPVMDAMGPHCVQAWIAEQHRSEER